MTANSSLAIDGGPQAIQALDRHRRWPALRLEDQRSVAMIVERGVIWGTSAPEVSALEAEFARFVGRRFCLAVNSGTAALHCCVAAAGVRPGDEVIVPAFTFSGTALAIAHQNATPVFCDIDPDTFNLDPEQVQRLITTRTRAIMPVHIHGLPADMDELNAIGAAQGIPVIEDAAQAAGALYRGRRVGALGSGAAFSLNGTKTLSGAEGGLFVTDDEGMFQVARRLANVGEDPVRQRDGREYHAYGIGWNYRCQEFSAALGRAHLSRLGEHNTTAARNAQILTSGLEGIEGLTPPHVPDDRTSAFQKYRLRFDPSVVKGAPPAVAVRDHLLAALRAEGVQAVLWQPMPLPAQPAFRRRLEPWHPDADNDALAPWDPAAFPQATRLLDESLVLCSEVMPLFVQPAELMEEYVVACRKVMEHLALRGLPDAR